MTNAEQNWNESSNQTKWEVRTGHPINSQNKGVYIAVA